MEEVIAHGGNLSHAKTLFPDAPQPWIDLSTGISPYSYPHSPVPGNVFQRLPDAAALAVLKRVAATAYRAPGEDFIAAAPGTQILLPIVAGLLAKPGSAAVLSPTYAEHARAARSAGFDVVETESLDRLADADFAIVVNPNNPTGRIVPRTYLLELARHQRRKGGLLVVDEAFMDVCGAETLADQVSEGGLIVLRSFGKFYGMAGLRLGFAMAQANLIAQIENRLGPWAVSGPALHIACEALGDNDWRGLMRVRLQDDMTRLEHLLSSAGLNLLGGTSLFHLVRDPRAPDLHRHLGKDGIFTRSFVARPHDLRLGLPGADDWVRVEASLRHF